VAVVLGAMSGAERTVKAARLLDAGFASRENLGTLEMLPASGYTSAPNICEAVRHRGAPLSEESEAGQPMAQHFEQDGANPAYSFLLQSAPSAAQNAIVTRNASGRVVLAPRAEFVPVPVYLGAAPGSSAPVLAAKPAGSALPASAMALTDAGAPLPLSPKAKSKAAAHKGHAISRARPSAAASAAPHAKAGKAKAAARKAPVAATAHKAKPANTKAEKVTSEKARAEKGKVEKSKPGKAKAAAAQ
jgi:D-alanyl-D-alanine carboxypeptidase